MFAAIVAPLKGAPAETGIKIGSGGGEEIEPRIAQAPCGLLDGAYQRQKVHTGPFHRAGVPGLKGNTIDYWQFDGKLSVRLMAADGWPLRRQILRVLAVLREGPVPRVWQM